MPEPTGELRPSAWVRRWSHLVPEGATVLDIACGRGRHVRSFAAKGCRVTGIDRDASAVEPLRPIAEILVADLEHGPWPLAGRQFDAVVVTDYLWRPRRAELLATIAPGGLLIHETFAVGQQAIGRPSRAEFLLEPGELLSAVAGWRIVAFEDGFEASARAGDSAGRFVQRIVALKPPLADAPAARARRQHLDGAIATHSGAAPAAS